MRRFFLTDQFNSAYFVLGLGLEGRCLEALYWTRVSPEERFFNQVVEKLHQRGFEDVLDDEKQFCPKKQIVVSMQKQDLDAQFSMTKLIDVSDEYLECKILMSNLEYQLGASYFYWGGFVMCEWHSLCGGKWLKRPSAELFVQHVFDHVGL